MRKSALFLFGLVVTALVALGLVVLSSASQANALRLGHGDNLFFMKRQFIYLGAGILVLVGTALFDYRWWREKWFLSALFYLATFVLLLLVFRYKAVNGSQRWIDLGLIRLQPSEFAKLATVVSLAVWLDRAGWRVELFRRGAMLSALIIAGMAVPVLREPDFGSVVVIAAVGFMLMFVAGVRLLHIAPFLAGGIAVVAYKVVTNANRMARIAAFFGITVGGVKPEDLDSADCIVTTNRTQKVVTIDEVSYKGLVTTVDVKDSGGLLASIVTTDVRLPDGAHRTTVVTNYAESVEDPAAKRADYQANQALVAIHNGGIAGVGLGESMQKQLYLPEAHTDFVFAIGAEELGLGFSVGVVMLFLAFFALAVYIARQASDRLGKFIVFGMAFLVFFQAMFNLGVVCKALPTKGMALPFFSYGGTNLLSTFFAVGTILSVGIHSYRDRKRRIPSKVLINHG